MVFTKPQARERLKDARRRQLISQQDVAYTLGISQTTYTRIENGYKQPGKELGAKLIAMFNLPPDYFDTQEGR